MNFKREINKGIRLLNEKSPGWQQKVDAGHLDMGSHPRVGQADLLTQVFGSYDEGLTALDIYSQEAILCGFRDGMQGGAGELTYEWKEILQTMGHTFSGR